MKRILNLIVLLAGILTLSACGGTGSSNPEYLILCARDNGFVAAYRGYFSIDGDTVTELSKHRYEKLIYSDEIEYRAFNTIRYTVDLETDSPDPAEWDYSKGYFDDDRLDVDELISQLKDMNISYTGKIEIQIQDFDEYRHIYIYDHPNTDERNEACAIFRNGEKLEMPDDMIICDTRTFYRLQ